MSSLDVLLKVLRSILQLHIEMTNMAEYKKQVLIEGNVDELAKIINMEASWVKRLGKLEEERLATTNLLLKDLRLDTKDITLKELIDIIDSPEQKKSLIEIGEQLSDVHNKVKDLNDLNTKLINQSLEFVNNTLNSITQESKNNYTYSKPNVKESNIRPNYRMFDKKA